MSGAFPSRATIADLQLSRLRALLDAAIPANPFQTSKLAASGTDPKITGLPDFSSRFPFTLKRELVADQQANGPHGSNLTFSPDHYTRFHQTSGTAGSPLRWLDTPESWSLMTDSWSEVFHAAGVTSADRVFFAFSFGPFLGFWLAFESAARLGCLCLPGGGLGSAARARMILDNAATALCCTPTYALRLAEVAAQEGIDLQHSKVSRIIVAGEPGGSVPATRARIEQAWPGARVCDHHGMTETGPVTYECPAQPGVLHVIEDAYYAEIVDPASGQPVAAGVTGELVLTTLLRTGSPLLRYRTGDIVQAPANDTSPCACGRFEMALKGGIIGRVDDMVVVRGVNVYPAAIEEIVRRHSEVAEYQAHVREVNSLAELSLSIEPVTACADPTALATRLQRSLQDALSLRVPVSVVQAGTLPRFEMKAKRWVRE